MTREQAWTLLNEYTRSDSLIKHALAVEAAMGHYARLLGEDVDAWRRRRPDSRFRLREVASAARAHP